MDYRNDYAGAVGLEKAYKMVNELGMSGAHEARGPRYRRGIFDG